MCDSVDRELTEGYDYDDDELSSTSSDTTEEWADVLDEGSSELCLVCLENEVMEFDRRPCCDHPICQTCLEKYIWSKVDDGVFRVGCPNPKCYSHLQVDEVTRIDPELAQLFYRRLVDANSDPHRKTCPNCCRITEVDPSTLDDRKAHDYGLLINCTQCQFQWCFQCHGPQHQGLKCDKNRASDHLLRKWAERRQSGISPTAQQCPVCKVYVQRVSGCHHMQCAMCGCEFCYNCGDYWDDRLHDGCAEAPPEAERSNRRRRLRKKLKKGGIVGGAVVGLVIAAPVIVALAIPVSVVVASLYVYYAKICRAKGIFLIGT